MIFIGIETAIASRLADKTAALNPRPSIHSGADLENAQNRSHGDASIWVAYNGIVAVNPLERVPHVATITTEFLIWVATRSASRHGGQQGTREIADPIIQAVLEALTGWRKDNQTPPLRLTQSPGQVYTNGFGWFPLAFHCDRQIRGSLD